MSATPEKVTAVFYDHASLWTGTDDDAGHTTDGGRVFGITRRRYVECDHYKCPAVVVVDPEDREQVGRLTALFFGLNCASSIDADAMQAALRTLASPPDPKPEEPLGLGAVVEDDEGIQWVRLIHDHHGPHPWKPYGSRDKRYAYADIAAVKVLSEGVTS